VPASKAATTAAVRAVTGHNTKFIAITRSFDVHADASGTILLEFAGQSEDALVNGIEVTSAQTGVSIGAGSPATGYGTYESDRYFTGSRRRPTAACVM
jgi:hypothetical protein